MTETATPDFVADFKLSITKALADQLAEKLAPLKKHPLTIDAIRHLDARAGVYLLWLDEARVYVGKAQKSLPARLQNHWNKLRGRKNIDIEKVSFVCLYVDEDLDAAAPERLLIKHYRKERGSNGVPWNTNGFGNKDPGRRRDKSEVEENHFDAMFPVNLAFNALRFKVGRTTVGKLLSELKKQLPYNLRFDKKSEDARNDYRIELDVPKEQYTAEEAIELVVGALPEQWQATALPGYLILYPEREIYPSALRWWRREDGKVKATAHTWRLAPAKEIPEVREEEAGLQDDEDAD